MHCDPAYDRRDHPNWRENRSVSDVKLFKLRDLDLTPNERGIVTVPVVNRRHSTAMGAGIGVFENCSIEWTVTYDEVLFIKDGNFTLRVGGKAYRAGPGDILWIPKDTPLVYEAGERVVFFYAVHPLDMSPSTSKTIEFPTTPPE
jgi:ethanolamine utilization protein EutQ (cupin superfamily)